MKKLLPQIAQLNFADRFTKDYSSFHVFWFYKIVNMEDSKIIKWFDKNAWKYWEREMIVDRTWKDEAWVCKLFWEDCAFIIDFNTIF